MKLTGKVKILWDNGTVREVKGMPYEVKDIPLKLILHESVDAWDENLLKISEETTGLGMLVIKEMPLSKVTKNDIDVAVKDFIKVHGMETINKIIRETILLSERE